MKDELKVAADILEEAANNLVGHLSPHWKNISKDELEKKPPRSTAKPEFCLPGSFLYVAYENERVLYVGESSISVRGRFLSDGSGAHSRKEWYSRVTHVHYARFSSDELPEPYRKMIEQALAIVLKPEFYGRSVKTEDANG